MMTKAIAPEPFDWETVDYMPTPSGQTPISVPWVGAGSLAGSHTLDVMYDYKKSDGWKLLYSTFSKNADGVLVNPYFVLYNVYRGTMRVYLYVTTQFMTSSSYLRDALSVSTSSGISTNILNFAQAGIINPTAKITCANQIQPKPLNGGAPFASNKWYMMEYELAFDPNICNLNYQNIQLVWQLDFCNVSNIALDGNATSSIKSVVSNTSSNNPFGYLSEAGTTIAKGGIAIGSLAYLDYYKKDQMGLKKEVYNAIYNGMKAALTSAVSGVPALAVSIFNSVIGGVTSSSTPIMNLKAETEMKIHGSNTTSGSFPSMPISWYVPGSYISSSAQNYIPLENETLGVFGWKGNNTVTVNINTDVYYLPDDIMNTGITYEHRTSTATLSQIDFSSRIVVNPAVLELADVDIVEHDVVAYAGENGIYTFPMYESIYDSPWESPAILFPKYSQVIARFIIRVKPKNGAPESYIYKTFDLDYKVNKNITYHD